MSIIAPPETKQAISYKTRRLFILNITIVSQYLFRKLNFLIIISSSVKVSRQLPFNMED